MIHGAEEVLALTGSVLELRVAPSPTVLPLVGAARLAQPLDSRVLVADAGHTAIKTAVAVIEGGALVAVEMLPARPAPQGGGLRAVESELVAAIVAGAGALGGGHGRHRRVVVSVASYLAGDAPIDDGRSIYGGITPQGIRRSLADAGDDISVEFVHDGTASAFGTLDPGVSAVVTIGTWLGIGFTPAKRALLRGDPVVR